MGNGETFSGDNAQDGEPRYPVDIVSRIHGEIGLDELTRFLSGVTVNTQVTVQFLTVEGQNMAMELLAKREAEPGEKVGKDTYLSTVEKAGLSRSIAGRSWNWLARTFFIRTYGDTTSLFPPGIIKQARELDFPVVFTGMLWGDPDHSIEVGELNVNSLKTYVEAIDRQVVENGTTRAITRMTGGDVGEKIFNTWKIFINTWQPSVPED